MNGGHSKFCGQRLIHEPPGVTVKREGVRVTAPPPLVVQVAESLHYCLRHGWLVAFVFGLALSRVGPTARFKSADLFGM